MVFAFASITVGRMVPSKRHLRNWAWGAGLAAFSTLLVGLRGLIPDFISSACANTLLALAFSLLYVGSRSLTYRPPPRRWLWLLPLVAFVSLSWFTIVDNSVPARTVIVSALAAPLLAMMAFEFGYHDYKIGPNPLRFANRFTSLVCVLGSTVFLLRIGPSLNNAAQFNYTVSSNALLVAPYFWAILFNVWMSIIVALSISAHLQRDLMAERDRAEASSLAKGRFLANMSHEIRTPMNAILGLLALLRNTELNPRQLDYTTKTESAARSLLGLLNDILDFSKMEAGKMSLDPHPFSVDALLRDLSVLLSSHTNQAEVLFDLDATLPNLVLGDAMRLKQVLINLCGNAIKFSPAGDVVLRVQIVDRDASSVQVEFSVKDNGIGIAPENQSHIFSGFSQAEASTTRRFGGTGLGLSISSTLVRLMGGELQLDSAVGHGSSFHFTLQMPIAQGAAPEIPQHPALSPTPHVLMVDDNPLARTQYLTMGQSLGWHVDVAASGPAALALWQAKCDQSSPYDAIFTDWQMPEHDGWETVQMLRQAAIQAQLAPLIIMVSSRGDTSVSQRSAAEQALLNGFLVKPFTASMLGEALAAARKAVRSATLQATTPEPLVKAPALRLQGLRLLVVEDNKINQMVAKGLLEKEGAQITLADNGQLGVDAVSNASPPFDAVLMDIQMPVMDGHEATRAIRQSLQLRDLPIIAMTANAMASDREACLAAGMNDHVGKPFELDHLVAVLAQHKARSATQSA